MFEHMSDSMSERMSEHMSTHMSEHMSTHMPKHMSGHTIDGNAEANEWTLSADVGTVGRASARACMLMPAGRPSMLSSWGTVC